jgi:hypothetical protein
VGRDSVDGIETRYRLDGLGIEFIWGGGGFSVAVHTGSGAHPASYTMGIVSFLGVKRPRRGASHSTPSRAEANERVKPHLYPRWALGLYRDPFTVSTYCITSYTITAAGTIMNIQQTNLCFVTFLLVPKSTLKSHGHTITITPLHCIIPSTSRENFDKLRNCL